MSVMSGSRPIAGGSLGRRPEGLTEEDLPRQHTPEEWEQLLRELQSTLEGQRPRERRPAAPKDEAEELAQWRYAAEDLRSTNEGRRLGLRFSHNADWLARALGVTVQHLPIAQLQNPRRPSVTIMGRTWDFPGSPLVQLAQELNGYQRNKVLAHELGHVLKFPDERLCEEFARQFCTVEPSEWADRIQHRRRVG